MKTILKRQRGEDKKSSHRRAFLRNSHGSAALEFAFIVPVALSLLTGVVEYGDAIAIDRKVTLTARTVTDLVTQYSNISQAELLVLMGASSAIVAPYSSSNIGVTVSEVSTDASGNPTITWTQALNGNSTVHHIGDPVTTLPTTIKTPNMNYIWGEVNYTYTPMIGYQVTGPFVIHDQTYMAPRISAGIPKPT
jgi:Flp pilus assembly protein TadG